MRDFLERQPQWLLLVLGVLIILGIGASFGMLLSSDEVVVVESLDKHRRAYIDVAIFRTSRPRQFRIVEGECRVQETDGRLGPFDVQQVTRVGQHLRLCPFTEVERNTDSCTRVQRTRLRCRERAKIVAGRRSVLIDRSMWLEVRRKGIAIVAEVALETYIDSVVRAEHPRAPFEAQRAQAIVARTFAMHAQHDPRHAEAAVCTTTHCQVYKGTAPAVAGPSAAQSTAGMILVDASGEIVPAYFHSTCGGRTLDADDVWPGTDDPSIVGIADVDDKGRAWCRGSRYHRWRHTVSARDLAAALSDAVGRRLDSKTLKLSLSKSGLSMRIGDKTKSHRVRGAKVHRVLGRKIGWDHVLSPRFVAKRKGSNFRLNGRGLGHGVGLCQTGAAARAEAGQSAEVILQDYFPKLSLGAVDDVLE